MTPEVRAEAEQAPFRAVLAVPLLVKDRVIGALSIAEPAGRVFDDDAVRLAQTVADQAALALENARLYEEVKRARDFLKSITDNSADAILTADVQGRVTYFSRGAEELFGYRAEEVLGQPVAKYYPGGLDEARAVMRKLKSEKRIRNYESGFLAKGGRRVEVNTSVSLLRDASGALRVRLHGRRHRPAGNAPSQHAPAPEALYAEDPGAAVRELLDAPARG